MSRILTDHEAIRDWAIARSGKPAMYEIPTGTGKTKTVLALVFGQRGDHENDDNSATESLSIVEWPDWLNELDERGLAVSVSDRVPGQLSSDYELVARQSG